MKKTMILAIGENNLVGKSDSKNGLPWHFPEDLQFYKKKTINKINIMGRKTFEQIGTPLPNRTTLILTRNKKFQVEGAKVFNSKDELDEYLENSFEKEVMITGGPEIFKMYFDEVNEIHITRISGDYLGDIYYNDLDLKDFNIVEKKDGENKQLVFEKWIRNEKI